MSRVILHVDMDAFFAAVEARANPSLRGKALAVAGPGHRTIVTTASYEARRFGVRTGMALGQARVLCPSLLVIRADHRKYSTASARVMKILGTFSPDLYQFSVDEAFLDLSSLVPDINDAGNSADRLRATVRGDLGLTCSVGVAGSRILAKLASGMNKPDGTAVIRPEEAESVLEKTPVGRICGIGPKMTDTLRSMGIRFCGQLAATPPELLQRRFGALGHQLSRLARGEDGAGFPGAGRGDDPVRSISHSATFPRDITDRDRIRRILLTLSEMVGRRARMHGLSGATVTVTVRYDDFTTFSRQTTRKYPVRNTAEIYRAALRIINRIHLKRPVRLLGVALGSLSDGPEEALLLPEDRRLDELQKAMDRVNERYGSFSVGYGDNVDDMRGNRIISPAWRVTGVRSFSGD